MARLEIGSRGLVVADLAPIAMTFVLLGLFLSVGAWINKDLSETTFATEQVDNETITFANMTWATTAYRIQGITKISNGTYLVTNTDNANYTFRDVGTRGQINFTMLCKAVCINAGSFNVTYQAYKSAGYLVISNSTSGLSTLTSWMPIIAVVIAAGLVVGLLIRGFGGGGSI